MKKVLFACLCWIGGYMSVHAGVIYCVADTTFTGSPMECDFVSDPGPSEVIMYDGDTIDCMTGENWFATYRCYAYLDEDGIPNEYFEMEGEMAFCSDAEKVVQEESGVGYHCESNCAANQYITYDYGEPMCEDCPSEEYAVAYGAEGQESCYIPANTEIFEDVGTFVYASNCYYGQ